MKRLALLLFMLLMAATVGTVSMAYRRDMQEIRSRVAAGATIAETAFGPIAYASGGDGPAILAIHGAGGGYDQGQLLAEAFLSDGNRWISPSRFGYPGTPLPADASTAAQADAFAALLDALGQQRVSIIAMSGGVPPALQFAFRYPERTRALVLLSLAPFAPLTAEEQKLPVPNWLYDRLFAADLPFWAAIRLWPRALAPLFDARAELTRKMTKSEGVFLDAMIAAFLPVSLRQKGLRNEGAAIEPAAAIELTAINAPMLIVQARDDRITPFSTAIFVAEGVGDAETLYLGTGGHLLLGHHDAIRQRIASFLAAH